MIAPSDLVTREPFSVLFPWSETRVSVIQKSIEKDGFNLGNPIHVWPTKEDGCVVLDGHHRLAAAKAARLEDVPVHRVYPASEREALEYAIAQQRDRRNMTPTEARSHIARAIAALDKTKEERQEAQAETQVRGGPPVTSREATVSHGRSSTHTAAVVGTSKSTVERVRTVLDSDNEDAKAALLAGEATPAEAARAVKAGRPPRLRKPRPKLSETAGFKSIQRRPISDRIEAAVAALEISAEAISDVDPSQLGENGFDIVERVSAAVALLKRFCVKTKGRTK